METRKDIVVTVHGIRTYGSWTHRLSSLLTGAGCHHTIIPYAYGYFSGLAFLLPFLRWIEVRRFRKHLLSLCHQNRDARLCIIAHSFGTYVVANAIRGIPVAQRPTIERLILCGSVLKPTYDCNSLLDGGVRSIVNDCCIDDSILVLSQLFVIGTGMAGRLGFYGFGEGRLVNRFHTGGHSGYFEDDFMRKWWLDVVEDFKATPKRSDRLTPPTALDGVKHVLTDNLDPVKIFAYLALIGLPAYHSWQALRVVSQAEASYLEGGEEQALMALLRQRQFPREALADSPLQQIMIKSGNYAISYTDVEFKGLGKEALTRTYNSRAEERGLFGSRWGSSLETRLIKEAGGPVLRYHLTGKTVRFRENGKDSWINDGFLLTQDKTGYQLAERNGRIMRFDPDGRVIEDRAPGTAPLRLTWKDGKLRELVGVAEFVYDENGQLSRVNLADGRKATYRMSNHMLLESTDVEGNHYRYEYDNEARLTAIKYDNGTQRTIRYDKLGLANYALYPNGYELKVDYGEMLKSDKGNWTESHIAVRLKKSGDSVIEKNFTLLEAYPSGRLFKTIEIVGDTRIETDYNPETEAPIQIRALGQVVTFEYDQFGRLVKQRGKDTIGITYDGSGRISGWERRDSGWSQIENIRFEYNANGNLREIRHGEEIVQLVGTDDGLRIMNGTRTVFISANQVMLDDSPANSSAKATEARELIARVLRTTNRPAGLFDLYRPCGCNAFVESVLTNEHKQILKDAQGKLTAKL